MELYIHTIYTVTSSTSWNPHGVSRDCFASITCIYIWPSSVNVFMLCDFFTRTEMSMKVVWSNVSKTQCAPCRTGISPYFALAELTVNGCKFEVSHTRCVDQLHNQKDVLNIWSEHNYIFSHRIVHTTTCFGPLYWPSSGCIINLIRSYTIATY